MLSRGYAIALAVIVLAFMGAGAYVVLDDSGGGSSSSKNLLDGAVLDRDRPGRRPATGGPSGGGSAAEVLRESEVADDAPPADNGR